jgi:hypothetical protein
MYELGTRYTVRSLEIWSKATLEESLKSGHNYGIGILNDLVRIPIDFNCSSSSRMEALQRPVIDWLIEIFCKRIQNPDGSLRPVNEAQEFRDVFSQYDACIMPQLLERLNREHLGFNLRLFRQCFLCDTLALKEEASCPHCSGPLGITARSTHYAERFMAKYGKKPPHKSNTSICYCSKDIPGLNIECSDPDASASSNDTSDIY